jgi:hypothetical protein
MQLARCILPNVEATEASLVPLQTDTDCSFGSRLELDAMRHWARNGGRPQRRSSGLGIWVREALSREELDQ